MATKVAATIATLTAPFVVVLGVALAVTVVLPGVTLTVDRTTYAVGETVHFTLRNGLHDPVYVSCDPADGGCQTLHLSASFRLV